MKQVLSLLGVFWILAPSFSFCTPKQWMNESQFREADWLKCWRKSTDQIEKVFNCIFEIPFLKCFSLYIVSKLFYSTEMSEAWQNHGRRLLKAGVFFYSSDCQKHLSKLIFSNYLPPKSAALQWTVFYSLISHSLSWENLVGDRSIMGKYLYIS